MWWGVGFFWLVGCLCWLRFFLKIPPCVFRLGGQLCSAALFHASSPCCPRVGPFPHPPFCSLMTLVGNILKLKVMVPHICDQSMAFGV